MQSEKMKLPAGETPNTSYERCMRHRAYYLAATIAQTFDLGQSLIHQAAFAAFCRFDDLGQDEAAVEVLRRFGLTLIVDNENNLLSLMQALGAIPQGNIQNGPTEVQ